MKLTSNKIQIILNYLISQKGLKTDSKKYSVISQLMQGVPQAKVQYAGVSINAKTISDYKKELIPFVAKEKNEMVLTIDSNFPNDLLTALSADVSNEITEITVSNEVIIEKEITLTENVNVSEYNQLQEKYYLLEKELEGKQLVFEESRRLLQNAIVLQIEECICVETSKNELIIDFEVKSNKLQNEISELSRKLLLVGAEKEAALKLLGTEKQNCTDLFTENDLLRQENTNIAAKSEEILKEIAQLKIENERILARNKEVESKILYKLAVKDWAFFVKRSVSLLWILCMVCLSLYQIHKMAVYFNVQMSQIECYMLAIVVEVMLWGINIARYANVFDDYEDSDNLKYLGWLIFIIRSATGAFASYYFMVSDKAKGDVFTAIEKIYLGANYGEEGQIWTAIIVSAFFVAMEMFALKLIIKFFFTMFLTKKED